MDEDSGRSVLLEAKVLGAVSSFVLAGLGCWLARHLEQGRANGQSDREAILMIGNTLASGILLAAALVHMLPDAFKALEAVSDFPLASTIAGSAFCFLVVLGEVAGGCMPERDEPHTQTDCVSYKATFALWPRKELMPPHGCEDIASTAGEGMSVRQCTPLDTESPVCTVIPEMPTEGVHGAHASCRGHFHAEPRQKQHASMEEREAPSLQGLAAPASMQGHSCHSHSACCRVHRHSDAPCTTTQPVAGRTPHLSPEPSPRPMVAAAEPLLGHNGAELNAHEVVSRCHVRVLGGGPIAEVKSFLLFFALSFHSVMEGLGLGSAKDGGLLLSVMVAVLAHKGLAAFALGCSLTQSDLPTWKFWVFVLIFSAGTPMGCAVGALFTEINDAAERSLTSGVCIAMASGTFLQVSSMELLPRAFAEEKHKAIGGLGLVVGFALMSMLAIWC